MERDKTTEIYLDTGEVETDPGDELEESKTLHIPEGQIWYIEEFSLSWKAGNIDQNPSASDYDTNYKISLTYPNIKAADFVQGDTEILEDIEDVVGATTAEGITTSQTVNGYFSSYNRPVFNIFIDNDGDDTMTIRAAANLVIYARRIV